MARTKNPNTGQARTQSIRFPENLWEEIMKQAEINDRSFNRMVVRMLEKQLHQEKKAELQKQ